ncbi:MAG: hypothetical protein KH338_03065 [Oscillospiraceae bacterium]|nr:hypothetical protein [Oscillospiraceae bacterium]
MVFQFLGVLFGWTWPIWSFVFVFSLISAIKQAVQAPDDMEKKTSSWPGVWASVSLSVILGGMVSLVVLQIR